MESISMSRHVGVLFRVREGGVLHISQSSLVHGPSGVRYWAALCDIDAVGTERSVTGRVCARCVKSAASIADAAASLGISYKRKGKTRRGRR
jgi:hypothetical protein